MCLPNNVVQDSCVADKYNYFYSAGKGVEAKWLRLACGHRESCFQNHCLNLGHGWGKTMGILASDPALVLWASV